MCRFTYVCTCVCVCVCLCLCLGVCVCVCVGRSTLGPLTRIWARTQLTFEHGNRYRLKRYLGCRQEYVKRSAGLIKEIEIELQWLRHFIVIVVVTLCSSSLVLFPGFALLSLFFLTRTATSKYSTQDKKRQDTTNR